MTTWGKQDSTAARAQGWDVFEIWDGRLQHEIQKHDGSSVFPTDEAARAFVRVKASATSGHDALCHKAWVFVFHSKLGAGPAKPPKGKKK